MADKSEITLYLHGDTDKALMLSEKPDVNMNRHKFFLPKSQVEEVRRSTTMGVTAITLAVPDWLIRKHGLENLVDE